MNKILALAGTGIALCSTLAFADPDPAVVPLDNAAATVSGNLADHPGNPGLSNALHHIEVNALRQQEKRLNHPPGQNKADTKSEKGGGGDARPQGVERVERADRPDRPDRVDRPDRPDRSASARLDRPIPPGHAK